MVWEVVPEVEQRVHVPAERESPRAGRDRLERRDVAVDRDQVSLASDAWDTQLFVNAALQLVREVAESVLAGERHVAQADEVAEHRQRLDVVAEVAGRQDVVR